MPEKLLATRADMLKQMFKVFESMNMDEAVKYFTEDIRYQFGNAEPTIGKQNLIDSAKTTHLQNVKTITFDIKDFWEQTDVVIVEMEITYSLDNGKVLTLPCTDILRMEGDLVRDFRAYMDISPLFS